MQWGDTLFLPSRKDTPITAYGLTRNNKVHAAACPGVPQAQSVEVPEEYYTMDGGSSGVW